MDDKIDQSQVERFREIARMMECDENEGRWEERLRKVVAPRPGEKTAGSIENDEPRRRS